MSFVFCCVLHRFGVLLCFELILCIFVCFPVSRVFLFLVSLRVFLVSFHVVGVLVRFSEI